MNSKYEKLSEEESDLRMVLIGKTGVGKSSAGNTILGRKAFKSTVVSSSLTSECKKETAEFEGQTLAVVDTPGLFDNRLTEEEVVTEIIKSISFVSPGAHVFLVVIQIGVFTEEEKETVEIIQKMFDKEAAGYTMALFTYGDALERENVSIETFISGNEDLRKFINQCCRGYHVFNNIGEGRSQVRELLEKINTLVQRNGGRYYTTEMFREAEKAIQKEIEDLRRKHPDLDLRQARRLAEHDNGLIRAVKIAFAGTAAGAAAGAGIGAGAEIAAGALVGSVAGPIGALIGAGVGLVAAGAVGAIAVAVKQKREKKKKEKKN